MDREFQRNAAAIANAVTDPARKVQEMPVARRQVGAGLGDADDRLAALQFLARDAEIGVALDIQRRHRRVVGIVEPAPAAEAWLEVRVIVAHFVIPAWLYLQSCRMEI